MILEPEYHKQFSAEIANRNPIVRQNQINQTIEELREAVLRLSQENAALERQIAELKEENEVLITIAEMVGAFPCTTLNSRTEAKIHSATIRDFCVVVPVCARQAF